MFSACNLKLMKLVLYTSSRTRIKKVHQKTVRPFEWSSEFDLWARGRYTKVTAALWRAMTSTAQSWYTTQLHKPENHPKFSPLILSLVMTPSRWVKFGLSQLSLFSTIEVLVSIWWYSTDMLYNLCKILYGNCLVRNCQRLCHFPRHNTEKSTNFCPINGVLSQYVYFFTISGWCLQFGCTSNCGECTGGIQWNNFCLWTNRNREDLHHGRGEISVGTEGHHP